MEKRIEIYYRDGNPKITLYAGLIGIAIIAIITNYYPDFGCFFLYLFWLFPFTVMQEAKIAKRQKAGIPALVIDGYTLEYKGKKIDLSEMCAAEIFEDRGEDTSREIIIFRQERSRRKQVMSISTDDLLISNADLLKLIQERIESARQYNPTKLPELSS